MFSELDTVGLTKDLREHGLERGDLGTVVFVYPNRDAVEVEFLTRGGRTGTTSGPSVVASRVRDSLADQLVVSRLQLTTREVWDRLSNVAGASVERQNTARMK